MEESCLDFLVFDQLDPKVMSEQVAFTFPGQSTG
jgi:hypothetical protein